MCFVSDSRTHAGIDNISTYSKMFTFDYNDRCLAVLSAGNLATTQGVIKQLKREIKEGAFPNLLTQQSLEEAADYVGKVSTEQQRKHSGEAIGLEASFIVGGQIMGQKQEAYLVYPQGNHITTSKDTPFLQVGENKYGKPILDRIIEPSLSLETAAMTALVSMDATMRSNLTVGPPIDVLIYQKDELCFSRRYRFEEDDEYLRQLKAAWDQQLRVAFNGLPPIPWNGSWPQVQEEVV